MWPSSPSRSSTPFSPGLRQRRTQARSLPCPSHGWATPLSCSSRLAQPAGRLRQPRLLPHLRLLPAALGHFRQATKNRPQGHGHSGLRAFLRNSELAARAHCDNGKRLPAPTGWLLGGLEFIWVYLALVLLTPLMAQVARKLPQWRRAVLVLAGVVFGLNAYIAFVSPGEVDRGLLEWRKLMSAASYLVAYLTGAALSYEQTRPAKAKRLLVGCILASAFIEGGLAAAGSPDLVAATSFKSTSLLSFLLAVASLAYARQSTGVRINAPSWLLAAASSILGFYISQSMTADIWRPAFEHACARAALAGGAPSLIMCGIALSLADVCVVVLFDQLTRSKLLRLLKLS